MKLKEIAEKYEINEDSLYGFLKRKSNIPYTESFFGGVDVEESNVEELINRWKAHRKEQEEKVFDMMEAERQQMGYVRHRQIETEEEQRLKRQAISQMLISSGFSFDGYKIVKYSGYISGDDVVQVDRGFTLLGFGGTNVGQELTDALVKIRRNALNELKEAAYDLGCNAVIGVDFDYITLEPQTSNLAGGTTYQPYVFCVTANGNAVVIEKIEE